MSKRNPRDDDLSATAVIEAVADADSRAILAAVANVPKTVADVVEECEIPMATAYRKVDRLTEIGLLSEGIRIRPNGRNAATYRLRAREVVVTVGESIVLEIDCSPSAREQPSTRTTVGRPEGSVQVTPMTDGGEKSLQDSPSGLDRFQTLFEEVTGTEEVIVEQNVGIASRDVDEDAASISTYVVAVTKDDGLTDTIDEPERNTMR